MSQVEITRDNVWDHFEEISGQNFRARCKTCKSSLFYASFLNIDRHFCKKHNEYFIFLATKKRSEMPGMYFNNNGKCQFCDECSLSENYHAHLRQHSARKLAMYEITTNRREYYTQIDNFTVQCKILNCGVIKTLFIAIGTTRHLSSNTHLKYLKHIQTDAIFLSTSVTDKSELLRNYEILRNFQAKGKSCEFQDCYIDITNFSLHVGKKHAEVSSYEKGNGGKWPWMYFKYHAKYTSQCLFCLNVFSPSQLQYLKLHLDYCHPPDTLANYPNNYDWVWKYCKKSGDFQVQCSFCFTDIPLNVKSHFNHHIQHFENTHRQKLTSTRRTYVTAGPSGSQQN